ncbi:SGNH/GDSL hydrolase family protein [Lacibacter luteus]|uniref:SGNH/GDSL hydrolase family protein n=1 Tax=Lacibacter luteus TaxID=2508719 RepID=A0A4Q1CKF9_9BACT|nr:SGNH/GDSL hydrolase family protein [Lacibacter luteus]RXK60832.1 SGNH/GDSL hydrolase family protein [Lacibacter luteus]
MQKQLTISLGKLALYLVLVGVIIFVVKKVALSGLQQKDMFSTLYQPQEKAERYVYFTGTSRTQCAINDSLLNNGTDRYLFFNAGFAYGTFISNIALANKLMNRIDSPVIFIELSVANGRMPVTFSLVSEPANMLSSMWPLLQTTSFKDVYHVYGPFTENYFIDYINLKPYLKIYNSNYTLSDYFGRSKKYDSLQNHPGTFLLHNDLTNTAIDPAAVPESYRIMIEQLLVKAEQTNCRIFFTLPVCINNTEEKERLLAIYNSIPEKNKLHYSSSFLQEINNPAYLADDIHLNVKGAEVYTNYVKETITEILSN